MQQAGNFAIIFSGLLMELQVGVKILLENKEGKYLLLRKSPEKYPEMGSKWEIVGGRIEPGQSLRENLKREVQEEIGPAPYQNFVRYGTAP
jgi:8-oxo-dGTP pyrophosphatase MutT (NUDIX family)